MIEPTTISPSPEPAGSPPPGAQLWSLVRFVLRRTLADPVHEGHLDGRGWPPGLRAIAAVALALYVLAMLAAAFGGVLRGHSRLLFLAPNQTLPAPAVPLVSVALIVALTCLFTAGLHLRLSLRLAVTAITVAILLYPLDWTDAEPTNWVTLGLAALLPVLVVARWRREFHWLEFVVSLVIIGHAVVVHQVFGLASLTETNPGLLVVGLINLSLPLGALAAPVAVLAGAALAEITTAAAAWTVSGAWSRLAAAPSRRWPWPAVVLVVLVLGRVAQEGWRWSSRSDPVSFSQLALGAGIAVTVGLTCTTATWIADRRPMGDPSRRPDPAELVPIWSRCTPVLALLVGAVISGQLLISILLRAFGLAGAGTWVLRWGGSTASLFFALAGSGAMIVAAVGVGWRGRRTAALLLMAFGTMFGVSTFFDYVDLITTNDDILAAVSGAAVLLLGWLAVRRRLTAQAQVALAGVLLLNAVYRYRGWFTEPLTQLVSLTGVSAALLVGLLWRILTDNGFTRRDSPGFPQPSRVLIALGNAVVGVTFAAQVALLGGRFDLDLASLEGAGDTFLGFPLVLAVSFAGLTLAASGGTANRRAERIGRLSPTPAP